MGPIKTAQEARNRADPMVHNITNFRGFMRKTPVGTSTKAMMNIAAAQRLSPPKSRRRSHLDSAKKPSSSSLRVGAGKGAPGAVVGSRIPPSPKGLSDCSLDSIGVFAEVLTGRSASRRLHPREFIESLKEVDAMLRQARE